MYIQFEIYKCINTDIHVLILKICNRTTTVSYHCKKEVVVLTNMCVVTSVSVHGYINRLS